MLDEEVLREERGRGFILRSLLEDLKLFKGILDE